VRVFRRADVFFSIGGQYYQSQAVKFNFQLDPFQESARPVTIRLANQIGRYIQLNLYFESRWIMISEVEFDSGELNC
jgi:discoidin domain receptor family protein 2